jgi:hypothetical protein
MHKIIILGKTASKIAESLCPKLPDCPVIITETPAQAGKMLEEMKGDTLIISRDASDISDEDLIRLIDNTALSTLIWPPKSRIEPFIRHFIQAHSEDVEEEPVIHELIEGTEVLLQKNQELTDRITSLQSVVRSLLSALSQYEPAAEAYADHEDAWGIIMNNMPVADLMPNDEEIGEDEYDEVGELDEDYADGYGDEG